MSLLIQPIPVIDLVHLRHYFTRTNGSCSNNNTAGHLDHNLVPLQPSSTIRQFSFGAAADKTLASSNTSTPQLRSPGPVVSINLSVDASPGCGGIAWPAGEVLAEYITHLGPEFVKGRNVLELGSGTGLVGLVCGKLCAEVVWITDQAPLLDIMNCNVHLNSLSPNVKVLELNWGDPLPNSLPQPDLILAADCVYFEPAFPLLVQTLSDLVVDQNTEVLFCYKKRRKADKRFFALLRKKFSWTEVMDNPDREVYAREQISLLRLHKKAHTI